MVAVCAMLSTFEACAEAGGGRGPSEARGAAGAPPTGALPAAATESGNTATTDPLVQAPPTAPAAPGPAANGCASVQAEASAELLPSDIIWAIDTSGSMLTSFPSIQAALNQFSERVVMAGIDAHIVLLAGALLCVAPPLGSGMDCGVGDPGALVGVPLTTLGTPPPVVVDSQAPSFLHLETPFGSGAGLATLLDSFPYYKHMLRPNARTQLVMTEDGAPLLTAAAVTDHIEGRMSATATEAWQPPLRSGSYVWNGVVAGLLGGPDTTVQLIRDTGGVQADLDQATLGGDPFTQLLDELATSVIVGALGCDYEIPAVPTGETFDRDLVNVVYSSAAGDTTFARVSALDLCADLPAWAYDNANDPRKVQLCPAACRQVQGDAAAKIQIGFGCATQLGPQ
jgi:hypothetical protein